MYNRYIPQSDGSYHRSRMPDAPPKIIPQQQTAPPCPAPEESACKPSAPPACHSPAQQQRYRKTTPVRKDSGAGDFLKQLLPKNLDTADLLVILLLLLMSGDCSEDQNTALLTLALYLFL